MTEPDGEDSFDLEVRATGGRPAEETPLQDEDGHDFRPTEVETDSDVDPDRVPDHDPSAGEAELPHPEVGTPAYVTLAPLTLDLVAERFTRLGYNFTRNESRVLARWDSFDLTVSVLEGSMLVIRFDQTSDVRGPDRSGQLDGICSDWNRTKYFLKAWVSTIIAVSTDDDGNEQRTLQCRWSLSYEGYFAVGIAPVQLQTIIYDAIGNVNSFRRFASSRGW